MKYKKPNKASIHFPTFQDDIPDLKGKTFVITGTTSGTGRVASRAIAEKGGRVVMLNRPSVRSIAAQGFMDTAYPDGEIQTVECDLLSFASVRRAAAEVAELCADSGVYALINNAGIMAMPDEATEDGFDIQMQANHLSHFLLTAKLFGALQRGAQRHGEARIVNHTSIARRGVRRLKPKYLEKNGGNLGGNGANMFLLGGRWVRYSQTKLANAAFTAALHQKLQAADSPVKALVAHPGFANTELQVTTNLAGGMAGWNSLFAPLISQSEEDGTIGLLSCAVLEDAESGQFYGPGLGVLAVTGSAKPFPLEPLYDNPETRELLWQKSCEAIGEDFPI